MAHIYLENVTKVFSPSQDLRPPAHLKPGMGYLAMLLGSRRGSGVVIEEESKRAENGVIGPVRALDRVSLDVADGETLSLIGPSGCGKSTLLRVVAGLMPPDEGQIFYDGQDMANVAPGQRGIGMVFQNYALYPHMTSKGNLGFFFHLRGRDQEVDERVRITARVLGVGFDELLNQKPGKLSGGQQQRVAIGRCITREPRLFLMDEPLSHLDAKRRAQTRVEIKRLLRQFRITTIYVTHDQTEAFSLGDRIAVMHEGRILQVAPYWALYRRPANRFVAGFVSPLTSFFPSVVTETGLRVDGQEVDLPTYRPPGLRPGTEVELGVRPENIQPLESDGGRGLRGQVEVVQHLPSERTQLAYLKVGSRSFAARLPEGMPLAVGQWVNVTLDPEALLLFDPQSGEALR